MNTIIQYYSDLHIEHNMDKKIMFNPVRIKDSINILILAGDIGDPKTSKYWDFIKIHSYLYNHIILITGNHEYYGFTIEDTDNLITEMITHMKLKNVYFLNNKSIILNGIKFIGSTFWSYIPLEYETDVITYLNDYKYIQNFNVSKCNNLHSISKKYIQDELDKKEVNNAIVISHHAPTFNYSSHPLHNGKTTNCAFSSNSDELVSKSTYWIFGHTHYNYPEYNDHKYTSKLKTNQLGYNWDRPTKGFNYNSYIQL